MVSTFHFKQQFGLESGRTLPGFTLAYQTFGTLNEDKPNVIWVCHALTANSDASDWWGSLIGDDKIFKPSEHFIVCANVLGSAYGSTGPLSVNPDTGLQFFHDFPELTIRDIVNSLIELRKLLNINEIQLLIGGSLGGQQALEWAIKEPTLIKNLALAATNAIHSPWGIAFNESQRLAIKADRTWYNYTEDAGHKGLKAARAIALLSYRNYNTYQVTQAPEKEGEKPAISYQNHQGEKLVARFNAFSYWVLSKAMDSHDVGRRRGGLDNALSLILANTVVISISSDILFPPSESLFISSRVKNAVYQEIDSLYGHDGFLIEGEKISQVLTKYISFLNQTTKEYEQVI
ncbi:MAG: homoserine O-acetyltransferase [Flavobacteriales bacterium]